MKQGGIKELALMVLANGIYSEVITEDQAINVLKAMDNSSTGTQKEYEKTADNIVPILHALMDRYEKEGNK